MVRKFFNIKSKCEDSYEDAVVYGGWYLLFFFKIQNSLCNSNQFEPFLLQLDMSNSNKFDYYNFLATK
jgi:hypothetical protein